MQDSSINTPTEAVGFPGSTPRPSVNEPKRNWKWLIILILFLVVIGGVTFFVFKSSKSSSDLGDTSSPVATSELTVNSPVPSPTATPADKTSFKVQVLNGTGISGEASLLVGKLKEWGYTNTTTGNATDQSATTTIVTFSSSVPQSTIDDLVAKLKGVYKSVTSSTLTLSDSDIRIVTGLRDGQTTQPAATVTPSPTATPAQ
ncbi:MAG TPA: LytR C-terminal domain-containing protein [Candidatus Saccharimonadales bacterium]|nr:LytR C-terminal domain-containing protein [Candidatus Saccharimonadales bacterium]